MAQHDTAERKLRAAAGMPRRDRHVAAVKAGPDRRRGALRERDDVRPVGRHSGAPPAGGTPVARHDGGDGLWLAGQRGLDRGKVVLARTMCDARAGRHGVAAVEVDPSLLEQREVAHAAARVPGDRGEQPGQQRGAQVGVGLRQRVGQLDERAARVGLGDAQLVELLGRGERQRQHLGEAERGDRAQRGPPVADQRVEAAGRRRNGQPEADPVVADVTADLLDHVIRVDKVPTPARRVHRQRVAEHRHRDRGGTQQAGDLVLLDLGAEHRRHEAGTQRDVPGRGR